MTLRRRVRQWRAAVVKGGSSVASGSGFIASVVQTGIAFANRFELVTGEVAAAIAVDARRFTGRTSQTPAVATSLLGVAGSAAQPLQVPAVAAVASLRSSAGTQQTPAVAAIQSLRAASGTLQSPALAFAASGNGDARRVSQVPAVACSTVIADYRKTSVPAFAMTLQRLELTRRVGGNVATNVTGTWTNPTNATGTSDGANATSAGAVTAGSRKLRLDYADVTGKDALTISAVRLHLYGAVTGDAGGLLSTTTISYNSGAGEATLETITGQFSNASTPRTYNLFALGVNTWTKINALQAFVNHAYANASATVSCAIDAIELEVVAAL